MDEVWIDAAFSKRPVIVAQGLPAKALMIRIPVTSPAHEVADLIVINPEN
ncbi:MAG: hypothetical protein M2R45_04987 [Verrucomicrobia subdivision 3 bacterium]|nr:hypothetical protein [Limisphaerales bacterium]MCS1415584.1 hypothetical protein [Limisphaerales bacterium]